MADVKWFEGVEAVKSHVVRISTPGCSGTGFLISNGKNNSLCGLATAAHVVHHAHFWEEPIRIDHLSSGKTVVLRCTERAVLLDLDRDTAAVVFDRDDIPFPTDPLPLGPKGMFLTAGNEIGWLGFPAMSAANLCFFAGKVSAWIEEQSAYLVDGVAINGVSGGPAFHVEVIEGQSSPVIMGVVSAYVPNRATGDVLPGLSVVRDVAQFHELAPTFASLDQAKSAETAPAPLPPPPDEAPPTEVRVPRAT